MQCVFCHSNERLVKIVEEYKIPFKCDKCGGLKFPYRAIRDIVFIWPEPPMEKTKAGVVIPEVVREPIGYGIVLSVGPGYYDKKGNFHKSNLKRGDRIAYNKGVPWRIKVPCGKTEKVIPVMGEQDVIARILEEDEEEKEKISCVGCKHRKFQKVVYYVYDEENFDIIDVCDLAEKEIEGIDEENLCPDWCPLLREEKSEVSEG